MQKIYIFDIYTKEYLRAEEPTYDPRGGHIMVPSNGTTVKPGNPADNQVAVWNGTSWKITSDFRGMKQVNIDTKMISTVSDVGDLAARQQLVTEQEAQEITEHPDYYTIKEDVLVRLSDAEIAIININKKQVIKIQERTERFSDVDWRECRYNDETRLGLPITDDINKISRYRQYLRDFDQQADWWNLEILTYEEFNRE